jgi:hypothetical protein
MACRRWLVYSLPAVAGSVPGEGDGGEAAGPGAEATGGASPVRRLRGLRQGPARPRTAPHGAANPHQSAARALGAQPAGAAGDAAAEGRRRRRGGGLALAGRDLLLAPLVLAAAEGARVVRRGAHAGLPAPGRRRQGDYAHGPAR